ncbi:hypothetical protein FEE95_12085 [Maribacter algarum]|uniref:Uncharacterized protein n=1 Tax=Maribacter algarum (ex Zhang et al. 2020) TaxID=2578118 RepID=A0A5S3PRD0_9FLAO|nr:hypothetical protein [Maribacter algarum]TMM57221.1 hypothetical protein FEE95_12085 [Maribacter algarum]
MKKFLKILLRIVGVLLLMGLIGFGILFAIYNEPIPEGKSGPAADALAEKMLKAVNNEAYKNTRHIEWSFLDGTHRYHWDKENGKVQVRWDNYEVNLNLNNPSKSEVLENGAVVIDDSKTDLVTTAVNYFNNDSFWLVAPFKVLDKGTERSIVTLADSSEALLVKYSSGGTTPGDTYLWKLLPNGFPQSYQMWVKVIPIGGLEASWDDWKIMESGVALPATHRIGSITMDMGVVKAYN